MGGVDHKVYLIDFLVPWFRKKVPSRKLTYPPKISILKMIFLFPRWDMLIPWRVNRKQVIYHCRIPSGRQITCDESKMIDRTRNVLRKEVHVTLNLLTTWSLYCQPKQCTPKGEFPQNYHINLFCLIPPKLVG